MLKKLAITIAFLTAMGFLWFTNATAFGEKYPVTEVYTSFSSSRPIKIAGKLSYFLCPFRCGEGFCEGSDFDTQEFLSEMGARVIFTEKTETAYSIYAYSPRLKNFIKIGGERVNLHINFSKEVVKVATPVIFGSF